MASSFNFYSLVSAVKDSSSKALATLSSDLKEFTTTVQGDVAEAAKEVKKKVEATLAERSEQAPADEGDKSGSTPADEYSATASASASVTATIFAFGSRLESVGATLLHSADEFLGGWSADQQQLVTPPEELSSGRRFRLLALQEASDTYVDVPLDFETFQTWKRNLSPDDFELLQTEVLAHYPVVKEKHDALVPATVDSDVFWSHYLYKASLLAAQEQRGALLLEKVGGADDDEGEIAWDVESPTHEAATDAGHFDSGMEDEEEKEADAADDAAIPAGDASADVEGSEQPQAADEGWVDVPKKTEAGGRADVATAETKTAVAAVDEDDGVDWGDDDEDELDAPAAAAVGAAPPATDEWGQWE